jgi:hypothetical protein
MRVPRKLWVALLFAGVVGLMGTGCGPKGASKETLQALDEAKAAYEKAVAERDQLKAELAELQGMKDLKGQCESLKAERDSLKSYLADLEAGY